MDAYQQGDVLSISQITADVLNTALEEPNLSVYTSRLPQISFVLFNLNNSEVAFLQDPKLRRALMLSINRPYIVNTFLQGQAVITDGPILPSSWAYHDGTEHFEYNPDESVNILKAEGYVIPAEGGDIPC
jgi:peptide/nickel transport system substrate-binding protein